MMRTIFKTSRKVIFRFNLSNCTSICLRKSGVVFAVILFFANPLWGQKVIGLSTQYDDRFDKWIIVTDVEGLEGTIEATWATLGDFSEWQYNLGDQSGIIRMRQKSDPNVWEIMGGGQIIEARTVFPGEMGHWQMHSGRQRVDVEIFRRSLEQWLAEKNEEEIFFYTYREHDLRDWIVENKATFSLPMQLALIFVPILHVISF